MLFLRYEASEHGAMVSWAGAQTWLQTMGTGDSQGFDSSSVAIFFLLLRDHPYNKGFIA